jgi:hypothetical protein
VLRQLLITRRKEIAGYAARAAILLCVLAVAGAIPRPIIILGPPRTVETVNPKMGVHTRLTDEVEEWKIQRTLQLVREMGAPWIVEYFPWGYIEPSKGQFDWQHADLVVDHAVNQGLTVIARSTSKIMATSSMPSWITSGDGSTTSSSGTSPI